MSGGHFDYRDSVLSLIADDIEEVEKEFDFEDREKLVELLRDLRHLIHRYDYAICSDTDMEDFMETWNEFKTKWGIK